MITSDDCVTRCPFLKSMERKSKNYLTIPERNNQMPTGSEFISSISNIKFDSGLDAERETAYLEQFLSGNIPNFLRSLVPLEITGGGLRATIHVMPDYLCIGSDDDFVHIPMNPLTAQKIMDVWGGQLPTRKIVNAIYAASDLKVSFKPMTPAQGFQYDHSMMHTSRYAIHSSWIKNDYTKFNWAPGMLVAGHKKDVIIDRWLDNRGYDRVGVYGAFTKNGQPIHDFRTHSHAITYKDYSHGIRCMTKLVDLDAVDTRKSSDLLKDKMLHRILSGQSTCYHDPEYPV